MAGAGRGVDWLPGVEQMVNVPFAGGQPQTLANLPEGQSPSAHRVAKPRANAACYSATGVAEYNAFLIATSRGSPERDTPFRFGIYP